MEANGYKSPQRKNKKKGQENRLEACKPLELVQMNILELFSSRLEFFLLIFLNDFFQFIIGFRFLTQTSIDEVIGLLQEEIDRYGRVPEFIAER